MPAGNKTEPIIRGNHNYGGNVAEKPLDIVDAFDYFKKKCDKFIKELGLIGWDIKYNLNHSKDINDAIVTYN